MKLVEFKKILDAELVILNIKKFIASDPIQIPKGFSKKQDIEISGLFAAVLAWGQRKTIINNCNRLFQSMDNSPHDFILNHTENDLKKLENFVHRTFNFTDLLYFISFLKFHYTQNVSLESAFKINKTDINVKNALINFHHYFFSLEYAPHRTRKHISTPERNSACKRINMYLRWMVRPNDGIDFGIWKNIKPAQLICPLDVHVHKALLEFHQLKHHKADWKAAEELSVLLKKMDANDPVKYDLALFELGQKIKTK